MGYYGDYIGFQFGDYHSHDLGLVRVSDGSRYTDPSVPNFSDTTQKIPGGDGTYYWDSFYTQRTFTIQCAFDKLSEAQVRKIRQVFNGKAEDWLVFDEVPYKKYRVKMQSPPQFKYLTFDENDIRPGQTGYDYEKARTYKGELTLNFISYYPYAISTFKYLNEVPATYQSNLSEWKDSVGLIDISVSSPTINAAIATATSTTTQYIYNPGDLETDCTIRIGIADATAVETIELHVWVSVGSRTDSWTGLADRKIILTGITQQHEYDECIVIDTSTNLVYGEDDPSDGSKTGSLYNKFLTSGDFFKLPFSTPANVYGRITCNVPILCHYDYRYF